MTIRFEVDQALAFRRGIDVPKSTIHLEVDPTKIPKKERDLIADHLDGIDVCKFRNNGQVKIKCSSKTDGQKDFRIMAEAPAYKSLLKAIRENDAEVAENIEHAREHAELSERADDAFRKAARMP